MNAISSFTASLPGACAQGLIWGIMALGVFLTFRVLNTSDLTVDGSIATGGAACIMLIRSGLPAWAAGLLAAGAGDIVAVGRPLLKNPAWPADMSQ